MLVNLFFAKMRIFSYHKTLQKFSLPKYLGRSSYRNHNIISKTIYCNFI